MIFKNLYRNTDYIVIAFYLGIIIGFISNDFRHTNFRWIYQYGTYVSCMFHFFAFIFSIINSILVWKEVNNHDEKNVLLLISLFPILLLILSIVSV